MIDGILTKEIKAEIVNLKYNSQPVSLPENQLKIEYLIEESNIKRLNQLLLTGDAKIHLIYHRTKGYTQLTAERTKDNKQGVLIVILQTRKGIFRYAFEGIYMD